MNGRSDCPRLRAAIRRCYGVDDAWARDMIRSLRGRDGMASYAAEQTARAIRIRHRTSADLDPEAPR